MFLSSANASSHKLTVKINPINDQAKTITGKTTKGTKVKLYEGRKTIAKKKSSGNFSIKVTKPLNFKSKYHLLATKKGYTSKKINLKIIVKRIDYDAKIKQINNQIKTDSNPLGLLYDQRQAYIYKSMEQYNSKTQL